MIDRPLNLLVKIYFLLAYIISASGINAQINPNEYQEEKPVLLRNEASFGIVIHSNGFGFEGKRAFQQTYNKKWLLETQIVGMKHPKEIKAEYPSVSFLADNRIVFNIKGNKYRLIVKINYDYQMIWIRFIGTHAEYNKIDATEI